MTKTAGIIAEYNPFHNGHKWQVGQIRSLLGDIPLVAVMSGHFTQRGEPALMGKWERAAAAVRGGLDLVLELPFLHACKSAEFFALGGVGLLEATGLVDTLCFGAECEDLALLRQIAAQTSQAPFAAQIKAHLQEGHTYAKATELAVKAFFPQAPPSAFKPNSILAIEYLKALAKAAPSMQPCAFPRNGAKHGAPKLSGPIASASAIRKALGENPALTAPLARALPPGTADVLAEALAGGSLLTDWSILEKIALYRLRQISAAKMRELADLSEGLENRLKAAALKSLTLAECLAKAGSRRYPAARLLRIVSQLLVLEGDLAKGGSPQYLRVLSFNGRGRGLIKKMRREAAFPVITNLPGFYRRNSDAALKRSLDVDIAATDIFCLLTGQNTAGLDFYRQPVYI